MKHLRHALAKSNLFKIIKTIRVVVSQCLAIDHLMRKLAKDLIGFNPDILTSLNPSHIVKSCKRPNQLLTHPNGFRGTNAS